MGGGRRKRGNEAFDQAIKLFLEGAEPGLPILAGSLQRGPLPSLSSKSTLIHLGNEPPSPSEKIHTFSESLWSPAVDESQNKCWVNAP